MSNRGRILALFVVLAAIAAAAPAASAITHKAATQIALGALKPGKFKGPLKVFSLPSPLPAGQFVYEAGLMATQHVNRLPFPVWLYWEDEGAGAEFAHPSLLLLIDARTGAIVTRRQMLWFLYIGKRLAPFLRTEAAYYSSRYVVYANRFASVKGARAAAVVPPRGKNDYATAINRKADLAHDCLITIIDKRGFQFVGDRDAMNRFADAVGLRRFDVSDASAFGLKQTVANAHNSGCTDVFLLIAGHGRNPKDFFMGGNEIRNAPNEPVGVNVHPRFRLNEKTHAVTNQSSYITPADLIDLVRPYSGEFGHVDFKIKIDSCFAGRFQTEGHVDAESNVVTMEFAAKADETGWYFGFGSLARVVDRASHRWTRTVVKTRVNNPDNASTFVNGNVHGLFKWASAAPAGDPLLDGINTALDNGKDHDAASALNWSQPYVVTKPPKFPKLTFNTYDGFAAPDAGLFSIAGSRSGGNARVAAGTGVIAVAESSVAKIGLLDTAGNLQEFSTAPGGNPRQIAYGPDGNFWFTTSDLGHGLEALGRITPQGAVSVFDIPGSSASSVYGIAAGPDGNLWFTQIASSALTIGVMNTSGTLLHEYTVLASPSQFQTLYLITKGPDGNMWFTQTGTNIGRISMTGQVTQFPTTANGQPFGITAGPDGKIWTAIQLGGGTIGRINTDGTGFTQFNDPDGGVPNQIAAGPDGNLYYVDNATNAFGGNQVGRVTPSGQITEYGQGLPADSNPVAITAGPDGRMWFTLAAANEVGAATIQ